MTSDHKIERESAAKTGVEEDGFDEWYELNVPVDGMGNMKWSLVELARQAWLAAKTKGNQMSESVWTSKKPDRAGWWWYDSAWCNGKFVREVVLYEGVLLCDGFEVDDPEWDCRWSSSPIAEPKDATETEQKP